MGITLRQAQILDRIIDEYITSAQPVSSQLVKEKCGFALCPATIRSEMQKLTEQGYLGQPHTSAGRVPTDKAYRFFVDNLENIEFDKKIFRELQGMIEGDEDIFAVLQKLAKSLSSMSLDLTINYVPQKKLFFKEGWGEIFQNPEFKEPNYGLRFLKLVKEIEENIEDFDLAANNGIKIYIGNENPILQADDFSMVLSQIMLPQKEKGILLILGPTRMAYDRNICLINSVNKLLESI